MSRGHNQTRAGVYSFALFGVIPFDASSCLALKVSALYKIHASPKEHLDVSALILSQLSPTPGSSPQLQPLHKQIQAPASSLLQQPTTTTTTTKPNPQTTVAWREPHHGYIPFHPPNLPPPIPANPPPPQNSPRPTASRTPSATPSTPTPRPPKSPPSTRAPGSKTRATSRPSASPRPRSSRWSPTRAPAAPSKSWA